MTKKNLPNIPIYIGDWERDCNVLGLESEAAWMRIVFKLWTKGKQNSIKMTAKGLQNLWRCSEEKMNEILDELIFNEIADISITDGIIEFTCRRFVKENKISKIRSTAAKSGSVKSKTEAKQKQNSNKTLSKKGQNTDYDIENESVNENVNKDIDEIKDLRKNENRINFKKNKFADEEVFEENFRNSICDWFSDKSGVKHSFDYRDRHDLQKLEETIIDILEKNEKELTAENKFELLDIIYENQDNDFVTVKNFNVRYWANNLPALFNAAKLDKKSKPKKSDHLKAISEL